MRDNMAILKILKHTAIVILISIVLMVIISYLWGLFGNENYSQVIMYWIVGTIIFGWLYLRYAEKKEGLS